MPAPDRFVSFDGTELAYFVDGAGADVLLIHGFAADAEANWRRPGVVAALVDAGHRVVSYDARGHGASDRPHDPARYADGAMVRDARALLDHVGVARVDVVGYSMGSFVASRLAPSEPRCRRLVLGGVGGRLIAGRPRRDDEAIAEALEADAVSAIADPVARGFRAFADRMGMDRGALAAIQRARPFASPFDPGSIAVPTLVVCGDEDTLVGSPAELAAAIPGAVTALVAGDHLTAVADPAFRRAIAEFLAVAP